MSVDIELLDCEKYEGNDACFNEKCSTEYHADQKKFIDAISLDELGKDDERVIRTDDGKNVHCYNEKGLREWVENGNETEPTTRVPFRKPYPENLRFRVPEEAQNLLGRAVDYNDIDAFRLYLSAYDFREEYYLADLFRSLAAMPREANREAFFGAMMNDERIISSAYPEDSAMRLTGALESAAESGNIEVVKMLLEDGRADPSPNSFNNSIVRSASNGFTDIVQMLLSDGRVNAGVGNNLALTRAVIYSSRDPSAYEGIVKSLLGHRTVKVSPKQMQSLIQRATSENIRRLLLQHMPWHQRLLLRFS